MTAGVCLRSGARARVVHVVTSLDFGGVESHMATLGELDRVAGYRHVFCAIGGGGRVAAALSARGAEVTCLQARSRIPGPSALWRLYRFFRSTRPAVVHAHGAEANFHALVAAALAGVPVRVGEEIGIPVHGTVARLVFRWAYRCAHKVIGVSGSVTQWLTQHGEVRADCAMTLLNPVRLPEAKDDQRPADMPFLACFVGRLEPVKNLMALVSGFERLVKAGANAQLWLVGDGSLRAQLEQVVDQRGLRGAVIFHGYQGAPADYIKRCHVCIQPSLSEGFGLAMVEAMGCGVPVISTRVGAAPQIIADGVSGWLVDGFQADAIQSVLEKAYAVPRSTLEAMGQAARASVASLFDPVDYLRQLENVYVAIEQGKRQT